MQTWAFESSSGGGTYTATLADDGKLSCTCKGWTMRRVGKPRHCKHTKEIAGRRPIDVRGDLVYLRNGAAPVAPVVAPVVAPLITSAPLTPGQRAAETRRRRAEQAAQAAQAAQKAAASTPVAPASAPPAPMLASAMTDPVTDAAFDARYAAGWAMEEKIDGHRCLVVVASGTVTAYSRPRAGTDAAERLPRALPDYIVEQLRAFPDGTYDGELVAVDGAKSWNVTVIGTRLMFVAFDVLALNGHATCALPYASRRDLLLDVLARLPEGQTAITTVRSVTPSYATVRAIWARGGEGAILKRVDSTYRPGARSPVWVKVKAQRAATLTVTGFEAGKGGPCSTFALRDADGIKTTVKVLGNALLRDVTANPDAYIGRRVVVSYQEKTPSGSYRHSIFDHFAGDGE